jgi:HSP20 family protein
MQTVTLSRRPNPFGVPTLRPTFDRVFEDAFVHPRHWTLPLWTRPLGALPLGAGNPLPLDVRDAADALIVEAALPGIRPEDVEVTVEDRTLTIKAESRDEHDEAGGETLVREIRRGSVRRSITLPRGLESDKATATFEHGVLRLSIPRAEAVKPRQIPITPTIDATNATDAAAPNGTPAHAADAADSNATNGTPADAGASAEA